MRQKPQQVENMRFAICYALSSSLLLWHQTTKNAAQCKWGKHIPLCLDLYISPWDKIYHSNTFIWTIGIGIGNRTEMITLGNQPSISEVEAQYIPCINISLTISTRWLVHTSEEVCILTKLTSVDSSVEISSSVSNLVWHACCRDIHCL